MREARWMDYLAGNNRWVTGTFIVPRPLKIDGGYLFKPADLPGYERQAQSDRPGHGRRNCLYGTPGLFSIPERPPSGRPPCRMIAFAGYCCARPVFSGELASAGIVHAAPIPLFHNRVQRDRREMMAVFMSGIAAAGWTDGCCQGRFPNFGPTGIRDFEHLLSLGPQTMVNACTGISATTC